MLVRWHQTLISVMILMNSQRTSTQFTKDMLTTESVVKVIASCVCVYKKLAVCIKSFILRIIRLAPWKIWMKGMQTDTHTNSAAHTKTSRFIVHLIYLVEMCSTCGRLLNRLHLSTVSNMQQSFITLMLFFLDGFLFLSL